MGQTRYNYDAVRGHIYIDFEFRDLRERTTGIVTTVYRVTAYEVDNHFRPIPGTERQEGFRGETHALRDGHRYGAIPRAVYAPTVEEVEAKLTKRVEDARKRYAKKFA